MKIKILDYIPETYGYKKGTVDVKIIYSEEKYEIFRGIAYFEKDEKKWVGFPRVKRGDSWILAYERRPKINPEVFKAITEMLEDYISNEGFLGSFRPDKSASLTDQP